MKIITSRHICNILFVLLMLCLLGCFGCNTTNRLKDGQYLLRSNSIKLFSKSEIQRRADMKDNLSRLVGQKTNTYALFGAFPYKLWLYNARYKKFEKDTTNFQLKTKTVEPPVIFDSSAMETATKNMKNYLFNQGYFYAVVRDSVRYRGKKAYVTYRVNVGTNYVINKIYDSVMYNGDSIDGAAIAAIVQDAQKETLLGKDKQFSMSMLQDERTRLVGILRDHGYYKFSQDNISFSLDTLNKEYFKDVSNPLENAADFISLQKIDKVPALNITIYIKKDDDSTSFRKYSIGRVMVFPDFESARDIRDSTMLEKNIKGILFKYHDYFVKERVIYKHIYLIPGRYYAQSDYDRTVAKLNELGIFEYIKVIFRERSPSSSVLDCYILLNRTKKYDFSVTYQVSNGTDYTIGNDISLNFRDKNLAKGANLLTVGVTGGVEEIYDQTLGQKFLEHFYTLTRYYGFNTSIDFPKFLAPIAASRFSSSNIPHTILSGGTSLIDRLDYFTLINTNAGLTYNWRETQTKTWTLSPAFINIIRLPYESDSFKSRLDLNQFLKDSYKQNFIEGENISFTFSDQLKKGNQNYSYIKVGFEEAGTVLNGINGLGTALNNLYNINYAEYLKFDVDLHHYFTFPHSTAAFRLIGGVGIPYGQSTALPYIKQYFVGGAYSIRGWRIRTLGPGSYYDSSNTSNLNYIDRTGDIKLEMNGEYRFDIAQFVSGSVKMNGAIFADAGNIWLSQKTAGFPGGEFTLSTLPQDIAASTGFGLRFDIASFIVLRFDLAFPIKKPYVFTNYGWVIKDIAPFDPTWEANNLVLNVAIGYPF